MINDVLTVHDLYMDYVELTATYRELAGLPVLLPMVSRITNLIKTCANGITLRGIAKRNKDHSLTEWWVAMRAGQWLGKVYGKGYRDVGAPSDYAVQEVVFYNATDIMQQVMNASKNGDLSERGIAESLSLDVKEIAIVIQILCFNGSLWATNINSKTVYHHSPESATIYGIEWTRTKGRK